MRYLNVVDIETTGFNHDRDMIVEIAIVKLDLNDGHITTLFNEVVNDIFKKEYVSKDSWIFNNSDMQYNVVMNASDIRAKKYFLNRILKEPVKHTAYNMDFDFDWLKVYGLVPYYVTNFDIMKCLTDELNIPHSYYGKKYPSVEESYRYLFDDKKYVEKHRALDDAIDEAKIIYECYRRGIIGDKDF